MNQPRDQMAGYHDDLILLSDRGDLMEPIVEFFLDPDGPAKRDGLNLSPPKSLCINLRDVAVDPNGVSCLGSVLGTEEARRNFVAAKIATTRERVGRLAALPTQHALLLLRECMGQELRHLLRTVRFTDISDLLNDMDKTLYDAIDFLRHAPVVAEGTPDPDKARRESIISLPLRLAGFGILSHAETALVAAQASDFASRRTLAAHHIPLAYTREELAAIMRQKGCPDADNPYLNTMEEDMPEAVDEAAPVPDSQHALTHQLMEKKYKLLLQSLPPDEQLSLVDNGSKIGTAWLRAMPSANWRHLTNSQTRAAMSQRLLVPRGNGGANCPHCAEHNSVLHFDHCQGIGRQGAVNRRHNYLRDRLMLLLKKAGHHVSKEPPILPNHIQRADLRVSAAAGAPGNNDDVLVDVTVKAPQAHNTVAARAAALAAFDGDNLRTGVWKQLAAAIRVGVHLKNQHYHALNVQVVPLVISSGGTLDVDFDNFLKTYVPVARMRADFVMDVSVALVRFRAWMYATG